MRNKLTKEIMQSFVPSLIAAALLGVVAAPASAAPAPSNGTRIAATPLGAAHDLGRAPQKRVDFSVVLPYRHAADLPYLLAAQRDPNSKYFRRYLKAAEFREYFSPTAAVYAAAADNLHRSGFTVETFANRTVLHAYGTAVAAERYLQTVIHQVRQVDGRPAYLNVTPATVPTALAGARLLGLSSVVNARVAAVRPPQTHRTIAASSPLFGPDGGYGPKALTISGDFPVEHGYTGKNSNVADLIDGVNNDTDIATFLANFGIQRSGPRSTTVTVDGGCGAFCFDSFSAVLDAEWTLAVAPGASLFTYQIPGLSNAAILDGFNAIASDDAVNIVNVGFGACEINFADALLAIRPVIAQAASEGITFETVAFGGANVCSLPPLNLPIAPASLDTVTAVGGSNTFINANGALAGETAFNSSNGGVSSLVALPAWQATTYGIDPSGRNVPDVVVPSSVDGTGASAYFAGAWVGGFAFINNAPLAGYYATVQEMYGFATPLGNLAPALYAALNHFGYRHGNTPYFTDVTLGCIGAVPPTPVCAKTGYDVATGIGSISGGYALAKALGAGPIASPSP